MRNVAKDLHRHRARYFSQGGEDGVLRRLLEIVGVTNRYFVEFGVGNGEECNTRLLREDGWSGLMLDCINEDPSIPIHRERITAENINAVLGKYSVPESFDVLSIDIDGNDHWVWKAIRPYQPRVVVIEYNCAVPDTVAVTMPYDATFHWRGEANVGQSLLAVQKLSAEKAYSLLYAEPPNAFLALTSILPPQLRDVPLRQASRVTHLGEYVRRREWESSLKHLPWVYV